jgi:tetratricopeptide (TPR) repeat protein
LIGSHPRAPRRPVGVALAALAAVTAASCSLRQPALQEAPGAANAPRQATLAPTIESTDAQLAAALLAASLAPSAEAFRRVGRAYRRVGVLDQAHEYFTRAVKVDPTDAASYEALARIWRDWGTPHLGLADAHRAVHYAPESPSAANTLGTVLQALGYTAEAKGWYGRALALDPRAWYALNNLCYAAIMTREVAIDMCRAAVDAAPDAKAPRNNLALAHAAAGDLDAASRWFRRAGDTAEAHYNYGVTLMGRGEYAQAVEAFRKALTKNPQHAQASIRIRQAESAFARDMADARRAKEGGRP